MGFKDLALGYCNMRLLIGGSISIIIGVILIFYSINMLTSKNLDTSNYINTIGIVKSAEIVSSTKKTGSGWSKKYIPVYHLETVLEYIVDSKVYATKAKQPTTYYSHQEAQDQIEKVKTSVIFYDPKDPGKSTINKNSEDKNGTLLLILAALMIIGGGISVAYRDSEFFCGATIASDLYNTFD